MAIPSPEGTKIEMTKIHGWLALDKPEGLSSAQAVARVKRRLRELGAKETKVGHAGTLDPFASGILPLALGEATKTSSLMMDKRKTYRFTVQFGQATDTDDLTGQVIAESAALPTREAIEAILPSFTGTVMQTPPRYSAVHVGGQRAYKLARRGEDVELTPKPVRIDSLELAEILKPELAVFEMQCGRGTYVRALARDMAEKLGTYGHVTQLRRTQTGVFSETHAISLETLQEIRHIDEFLKSLRPIEDVLDDIPVVSLASEGARRLRQGQPVGIDPTQQGEVLVMGEHGPVAIGWIENRVLKPKRIFNW